MASLVSSFVPNFNGILVRLGETLKRERDIMRKGLAIRAVQRKNHCVLKDMSSRALSDLGVSAGEIEAIKKHSLSQ